MKPKVIILESSREYLKLLDTVLDSDLLEIEYHEDPKSFLQKYINTSFYTDILILSSELAFINNINLLRAFEQMVDSGDAKFIGHSKVKVIVCSGQSVEPDHYTNLKYFEVIDYLFKPTKRSILTESIQEALTEIGSRPGDDCHSK